ncbi:MAG: hypothetical protein ABMB14_15915, partial [Myxococcota bacterium]
MLLLLFACAAKPAVTTECSPLRLATSAASPCAGIELCEGGANQLDALMFRRQPIPARGEFIGQRLDQRPAVTCLRCIQAAGDGMARCAAHARYAPVEGLGELLRRGFAPGF